MTQRSDIRKAELDVIDVARQRANTIRGYNPMSLLSHERALIMTVDRLDALGLAEPAQARANRGGPVTAQQAATYMNVEKAKSLHAQIIRLLYNGGHLRTHTAEEIQLILHSKHQSLSPRINELRDAAWITDTGSTRLTRSGREAIVWSLSRAALEAIRGQEGMTI